MRYISTRGDAPVLDFEGVTLAGLASDGGLYLPEEWPQFTEAEIADLRGLPYPQVAARVLAPFVGESLPPEELLRMCETAYRRFAHVAVAPLVQLDERHSLLELFHGPTLAFKDIALQLLGELFEHFLARRDARLTLVGATSGDTGSAAIAAVKGRERLQIVMLHPSGRISEVQRRQMTTVDAANVHNVAIDGSFDDAQAAVKRMFTDQAIGGRFPLGAVNSINWARLLAQIVYYFTSANQLGAPDRPVAFSVPTGNFGDVFAGYCAAKMGLPVERLIVATNANDILHRALAGGDYAKGTVTPTAAPSMDIQVSSNFERFLFDSHGRDSAALAEQMRAFEASGTVPLSPDQRTVAEAIFASARVVQDEMDATMRWAKQATGQVIDPHTAIGLAAARRIDLPREVPVVTLATAHPAKFPDAVRSAIAIESDLPERLGDLFALPEHATTLPSDYGALSQFVTGIAEANH